MDQPTFADLEYRGKKRRTRRELFLERMDGLIPWQKLEGAYPSVLSQAWKRPPALPAAGDAADSLRPALL